ncbi:MAG: helix-turn-helix domain-containing protein [Fretibacterium sp.]|nr:helix-turn-helix domain-containing protein [Fretibacterium sp.]
MEKLYSAAEAAKVLGVSRRHVLNLCRDGTLPRAQKVGNTWAIPASSLGDYKPQRQRTKPIGKAMKNLVELVEQEQAPHLANKSELLPLSSDSKN